MAVYKRRVAVYKRGSLTNERSRGDTVPVGDSELSWATPRKSSGPGAQLAEPLFELAREGTVSNSSSSFATFTVDRAIELGQRGTVQNSSPGRATLRAGPSQREEPDRDRSRASEPGWETIVHDSSPSRATLMAVPSQTGNRG